MADRGPVKIRDQKINALIELYKKTFKTISQEIIDASESGKISRAKLMVRVNLELEKLGVDVEKFVKTEIPKYYNDGAAIALQDLRKLGVDLSSSGSAVINAAAIQALVDETAGAIYEGITGISRNVSNIIGETTRKQLTMTLAEGKLTAETRKTISAALKQQLEDRGIAALKDKAGREWTFDRYTAMLTRTKAVEARNQGLANKMVQYGYDLVQISNHGSKHLACARWEGRIVSLTGQTPGYPTLAEATNDGLFHPNCEHAANVIDPKLAKKTEVYDNPYLKMSPEERKADDLRFRQRNLQQPVPDRAKA